MYHLKLSRNAEKYLKKLGKTTRQRIENALLEIQEMPYTATNIKKLVDSSAFRKRVGEYRVVYEITDNELDVYVIDINNRSQVYKRL